MAKFVITNFKLWKYIFLFFTATMSTGAFFCINIPNIVQDEMISQLNVSTTTFFLLYSIPGYPSIVLCFLTGYIIDSIGLRVSSILSTFLVFIGQIINTVGLYQKHFGVVLCGFIIQNYGVETSLMAQNSITTSWFSATNKISLAMGILMFNIRITEFASSWIIPPIYNAYNSVNAPMIVGDALCLFSTLFSAGGASLIDYMKEKAATSIQDSEVNHVPQQLEINQVLLDSELTQSESDKQQKKIQVGQQKTKNSGRFINKFINIKSINIRDILKFDKQYWLLNILCALGYSIFYPFMQNMESILKDNYNIDLTTQGRLQSIPYFFALGSPLVGLLVDRIEKRPQLLILGFLCLIISFGQWIAIPQCKQSCVSHPILPLIFLGLFFVIFSGVIFSCISLLLKKTPEILGLGFGLVSSIKSIGMCTLPTINTHIIQSAGYNYLFIFLMILSMIALAVVIQIYLLNKSKQNLIADQPFGVNDCILVNEKE